MHNFYLILRIVISENILLKIVGVIKDFSLACEQQM